MNEKIEELEAKILSIEDKHKELYQQYGNEFIINKGDNNSAICLLKSIRTNRSEIGKIRDEIRILQHKLNKSAN